MKKIIFLALIALGLVFLALWMSGKVWAAGDENGYTCEQQAVYEHQEWEDTSHWGSWTAGACHGSSLCDQSWLGIWWHRHWITSGYWEEWKDGECGDDSPCNQREAGTQHSINGEEWLDGVCPEVPGQCPAQCGLPESTVPDGFGGTVTCPTIVCLDPCRSGQSYTGDYCGWSPKPWEPEEYKPSVCTAALPKKPSFTITRVNPTTVKVNWKENDENTTGWTLSWGYSATNLPYGNGGTQLPKETTEFTIGNLLPNANLWVELSRWNGNDCAVYSNRVNM